VYADEIPEADEKFLQHLGGGFCSPDLDGGNPMP
jgi:uronate dehydrogenase